MPVVARVLLCNCQSVLNSLEGRYGVAMIFGWLIKTHDIFTAKFLFVSFGTPVYSCFLLVSDLE